MYDVFVIGAGPGGYVAAIKAAQRGAKVAIADSGKPGGVCLNYGCIPTKSLLASARALHEVKSAADFGILGVEPDAIRPDWKKMLERKDQVVAKLNKGVEGLLKKNKIDWIQGEAEVIDPSKIRVEETVYETKKLILATGIQDVYPDIEGLEALRASDAFYDSRKLLAMETLPEELLIIGGHTIAVEFAVLFQTLGVHVTLLHLGERLLPSFDEELSEAMHRQMKKLGIHVETNVNIDHFSDQEVHYHHKDKEKTVTFSHVYISLGTAPREKGLESLQLPKNDQGFIQTDEFLQTGVTGVYAIGDMNGKYALAHVASHEGITAATHATGGKHKMNYRTVPTALYTFPEMASVGLTEAVAKSEYSDATVSKFSLTANGKALAEGESVGFVKIISEPTYGEILGVHIVGDHATDMIAEAVMAIQLEATVHDLALAVHAHPTPGEILMEAAFAAIDRPIHG